MQLLTPYKEKPLVREDGTCANNGIYSDNN